MNKRQIDIMVAQATNKSMPPKYGPNWDGDAQWSDNGDGTWTGESWPTKPEFSESCYWPPHYSTDIAAAVSGPLDALYDIGCWIKISNQIPLELGKKWRVEWQHFDRRTDYVWADTLSEAICLAFLKARGVEVEE
jgi:hypothetical protein